MRPFAGLPSRTVAFTVAAAVQLASLAPILDAQEPRTANDRVYSDAQAARGQTLYQQQCATCHGDALEGKSAPPLAGSAFLAVWGAQPVSELAGKIRNTMPADAPGKLQPKEAADLVAYILQAGKFPSGRNELSADEAALKSIVIRAAQPSAAAPVASQAPAFPPLGNLNQLMRAILFPNSNIIFNVQTNDPGAPAKPGPEGTAAGFSWTTWGAGLYSGWQIVDYAAIALADSAPLLLTPGRRCQNGRPVPVDRPDWIKYTQELAEVGRTAYRVSQTRNQEAVSDFTTQLAEACAHCHQVYRDKRGFRQGDPAAAAARCTP
jgi:mono/diheme cytochrome c family protein